MGVAADPVSLLGSGSTVPEGTVTVAVLTIFAALVTPTAPLITTVILELAGMVGITPETRFATLPIVVGQTAPPLVVVHDTARPVITLGTASLKLAPSADDGPALLINKL